MTQISTSSPVRDDLVRPEFDHRSETYRVRHDDDSPWKVTTTLVHSLGTLTEYERTQLLPLHRAVDPDVLERHVQTRTRGAELSFEYHGYQVTVEDDGTIEFSPLDETEG